MFKKCIIVYMYIYISIYIIDIYLDVVVVVSFEAPFQRRHLGKYQLLCSNLLSTIPHYVVINNLLLIYIYIYIYVSSRQLIEKETFYS